MDMEEFRIRGKEMVEYICTYMTTLLSRRVVPAVEPGYLRAELPSEAPYYPEPWEMVMKDVEKKIMPGVTHWQHPRFHAYFPNGNAYPSILGDMLSGGIGCVGFSWAASPACTELEVIMLNWVGKAIGLPPAFLAFEEGSNGGGVINGTASENVLVTMLAARANGIKQLKHQFPNMDEGFLLSKLIAYCSHDAHSCVEKAAMISFIKLRILQPDYNGSLRGDTLKKAMEEDVEAGRVPFFVSTTLGTTSRCAYDNLTEIGPVVRMFPCVWLHVDAAYAGSSFLCPEHRHRLAGVEYADSFDTNPNKLMLTSFDCSLLWVTNRYLLTSALVVDPLYLQHSYDKTAIDYRHWGISLSRRFRSFKLWFMLRSYGISGLQKYVRLHCELAKYFEKFVKNDDRFEVCNEVTLGLVCFRLVGSPGQTKEEIDDMNKKLLTDINASGKLHMVPASLRDSFIIRFCVVYQNATPEDIEIAWDIITDFTTELFEGPNTKKHKTDLTHRVSSHSFFVRMVSDNELYNPGISKIPTPATTAPPTSDIALLQPTPSNRENSWISWPLGYVFQSVELDANGMPLSLDRIVQSKKPSTEERDSPCAIVCPLPAPKRTPSPSNN